MSDSSSPNSTPVKSLERYGRIWSRLTRLQCAGILHIAMRYGERKTDTNAYIDVMAMLQWAELGHPLQVDIAHAIDALETAFR